MSYNINIELGGYGVENIVVYVALAVVAIFVVPRITRFLQRWWALRKLPGPRGSLLCGSISVLSMPGDARVHKLREMIAVADRQPINGRSTGVCRLWLGPGARAVVVLNRPELFKDVLNDRSGAYEILDRRALKFITGQGLLTARGDHWRAQRRIISPAFEFAKLKNMLGTMVSCTDTLVAHLRKNSTGVKAPKVVHAVTLAVISQTAFGLDLNPLVSPDHPVLKTLDHVFGDSAPNLTGWRNPVMLLGLQLWMSPGFSKLKRDIEELRAVLRASIEKRISETRDSTGEVRDDGKKDLLALLVAAKDADTGEFMSTELLMDEVMTFFIAGQDTTATLMSWLLSNFVDAPEWCSRLCEEIDSSITPPGRVPVYEDLAKMPVLDACIRETLRYSSPVPMVGRMVARDGVSLGGHAVPKGAAVLCAPWLVHHNEQVWANSDSFDPSRFLGGPKAPARAVHDYAYVPFSAGHRRCIGANLAILEAKVMAIRLFQSFTVRRSDGCAGPTEPEVGVVRKPKPDSLVLDFVPRI